MRLGLGLGIARTRKVGGLFPAAKTIISEIETRKGSAMTSAQRKAIDTFIRAETTAGRWGTVLKRFFLPGWANLSANAYDWVTGAVGSFVNNPTAANGYVQGNGVDQYFDSNATFQSLGITGDSLSWGATIVEADVNLTNRGFVGAFQTTAQGPYFGTPIANLLRSRIYDSASEVTAGFSGSLTGTLDAGRLSGSNYIRRRTNAGYTELTSQSRALSGTIPTSTIVFMAIAPSVWSSAAKYGEFHICSGMSSVQSEQFSLNIKNLYESLFGTTIQ